MKKYTTADIALSEVQSIALQKKARLMASELQQPLLVLFRELYRLDYSGEIRLRFTLCLKSPFDEHFTKINQFHNLEEFCLWYVSRHPFKDFDLLNFKQI